MSDQIRNINRLAERLEQITLPDENASWEEMRKLLDKRHPRKKGLFWILGISMMLFFTLLIGSLFIFEKGNTKRILIVHNKAQNKQIDSIKSRPDDFGKNPQYGNLREEFNETHHKTAQAIKGESNYNKPEKPRVAVSSISKKNDRNNEKSHETVTDNKNYEFSAGFLEDNLISKVPERKDKIQSINIKNKEVEDKEIRVLKNALGPFALARIGKIQIIDSLGNQNININRSKAEQPLRINSRAFRWGAGIGINQFLPVGDQHDSGLNANSNNTILSEYIPSPFLSIYFGKKWNLQIEAEINTPQYTNNPLVKHSDGLDSLSNGIVVRNRDSSVINKLFYFVIPISLHYNLFDRFFIGAGLQFSRLTNAVEQNGSILDTTINGSTTYLHTSSQYSSLKNSTDYHLLRSDDWRLLMNFEYRWRNLEIGLRYNKAFAGFLKTQISTKGATNSVNSSLQIYLKYIIFRDRNAIGGYKQ